MHLKIHFRLLPPLSLIVALAAGCLGRPAWPPPGDRSAAAQVAPEAQEAAYRLLTAPGEGEPNEYGWICEYSTVGIAPRQRQATLVLVRARNIELLRRALGGPNLEGRIYAADALLYLSKRQGVRLIQSDRDQIAELRSSDSVVRTCGNAGSYKIYPTPARAVLSNSAIARIPRMYEHLFRLGYGTP
jgi:hypothetical protein